MRPRPGRAHLPLATAVILAVFLVLTLVRPPSVGTDDPTGPALPEAIEGAITPPLTVGIGSEPTVLAGRLLPHLADLPTGLRPVDLTVDGRLLVLEGAFRRPVLVGPDAVRPVPGPAWSQVLLSPDGRRLALLDTVGRASVWELDSPSVRPLDPGPFRAVHWSPDSRTVGLQGTARYQVWDAKDARPVVEGPGRLLAVGPRILAVWREGLLGIEDIESGGVRVFDGLSPSTTAAVVGGLFSPDGSLLALPVLDGEGPGLFLLHVSSGARERLTDGEVVHPLFTFSGEGSEVSWVDRGRLWRRAPSGAVSAIRPVPDDLVRLRSYDRALVPRGLLLLRRGGQLVERPAGSAREDLRSAEGTFHLAQADADSAVIGSREPRRVVIRIVGAAPRTVPLAEAGGSTAVEAAVSPEGTWAVMINAGIRLLTGGREYGPLDSGGSPTFAGETLLYADRSRVTSIDTRRLPFMGRPVVETADLADVVELLGIRVVGDRLLVLGKTPDGRGRLVALPLAPDGRPAPTRPVEVARFPSTDLRLEASGDMAAVEVGGDRTVLFLPGGTLALEGRLLAFSPDAHWVLLDRDGGLVAASTRGRGEVHLPGFGADQAAWLDG